MTEEDRDRAEEPAPKKLPPLPGTYHKARARLVLFSAVLLFWDVVGIQLSAIPGTGLEPTKNPEAIPWLVALVVLYFGGRLWVEWLQCDPERRSVRACRIDHFASYGIAVFALGVFVFQQVTTLRVAELLSEATWVGTLVGIGLGAMSLQLLVYSDVLGLWVFSLLLFVFGGVGYALRSNFQQPLLEWSVTQYFLATAVGAVVGAVLAWGLIRFNPWLWVLKKISAQRWVDLARYLSILHNRDTEDHHR